MLSFVKKYGRNDFSQNLEDGLIEEIAFRLNLANGFIVEFGAHNGVYCSNSRSLILKGWSALLIEGDDNLYKQLIALYFRPSHIAFDRSSHTLYDVTALHRMVTVENINEVLPATIDILSIDVDGIDYKLWEAYRGTAKVVIIEINSSIDPLIPLAGDPVNGSSYCSMWNLGKQKGCSLLCHCGNLIFVRNDFTDLFPEIVGKHPLRDIHEFFDTSWLLGVKTTV